MNQKYTLPLTGFVIFVCLLLQSCSKIASDLQYDLSMQTASVNIIIAPISDTTAGLTMGTVISSYKIDSFIKSKTSGKLGVSNISSAKMSSSSLTLVNPNSGNNFANFQNCNVNFFTNTNTSPFSLAVITNNPDTYAATLNVPVDATTDMKTYLQGNELTYSLSGKLRRNTTDTLTCTVQLSMNVHVHG